MLQTAKSPAVGGGADQNVLLGGSTNAPTATGGASIDESEKSAAWSELQAALHRRGATDAEKTAAHKHWRARVGLPMPTVSPEQERRDAEWRAATDAGKARAQAMAAGLSSAGTASAGANFDEMLAAFRASAGLPGAPRQLILPASMAAQQPDPMAAMLAKFRSSEQVADIAPPRWLVEGAFHRKTLARMSGHPGNGKSFVALDLACHVATGKDWHGRKVDKGRAIYLAAEGLSGLALRLRAWELHHGLKADGLLIYPEALQVAGEDWPLFVACCVKLGADLIVIDTQARVTAGTEENSNSEMGQMVARLDGLRMATGGTVLLIHHLTKGSGAPRGASAVNGAMDTELVVSKKASTVSVDVDKQKDAEEAEPVEFELKSVHLGVDDDGEPISSAVLTHTAARARTPEAEVYDALSWARGVLIDQMLLRSPNLGATKAELVKWGKEAGISQATAYRAVDDLEKHEQLEKVGQRFFLSEEVKEKRKVLPKITGH